MGIPPALSALIEKRAELAGDIRGLEDQLEQKRSDILHIDAVIRLIDPEFQPDAIVPKRRRPRREWFGNNELLRLILDTLRQVSEPLTAKEVATAIMEKRGFDTNDAVTVRLIEKRVFSACHRRRGALVEEVVHGPRAVGWRVRG